MTPPFIHPRALCETAHIGHGTRIWAFAHILPGARLGADCNVCDGVFIENDVRVGDRVTVKCGVQLWDGVDVEDDVFIGPNATFTNDAFPRSRVARTPTAPIRLRRGCSIGANATILPGVVVGPGAMIGAGTVVTQDVPANAVVVGNPARIADYAGAQDCGNPTSLRNGDAARPIQVEAFRDARGRLAHWPIDGVLGFVPRRMYIVDGAPDGGARGGGAYRRSQQLLIATQGSLKVALDDGRSRAVVTLSDTAVGLHVPAMVWTLQFGHSADAALLVLASEPYAAEERISDYAVFASGG